MTEGDLKKAGDVFIDTFITGNGKILPVEECLERGKKLALEKRDEPCGSGIPDHPFAAVLSDLFEKARSLPPGQRTSWSKPKTA